MPHSFLRGRWLRTISIGVALNLSIASLSAVEGSEAPETAGQPNGRATVREADYEDHGQYPGLTFVKPGISSTAVRKQAIVDLQIDRLSPDAQRKSQTVIKIWGCSVACRRSRLNVNPKFTIIS